MQPEKEHVYDPDGHLVCKINISTKSIEIKRKNYITSIEFDEDDDPIINHIEH